MIATIVAWSVISVATVGLVVGLSGPTQAKVDRNVDQLSKTNLDQLNKFDETLNSISRKITSEKKANKEKYDLEQKAKAEEAKRKQDEAEQPGELVFITCATYDQGTVWVLRTQRI